MSTATQLEFPMSREDRQAWNFRRAAREILAGEGVVTMEVPGLSRTDILNAWTGLERFALELPLEERPRWQVHVPRDARFNEPDDGAIFKTRSRHKLDHKLYFHFRPDLELLLRARGVCFAPWQRIWFDHMGSVWDACERAFRAYATELEREWPELRLTERLARLNPDNHVLRLLRYEPYSGMLAEWHTDRASTTLHVAESAPGLKVRKGREVVSYRSPQAPEVYVFPGDQMAKITHNGVPAVYHAVENMTGSKDPRFSAVFFAKTPVERL